MGGEEPDDLHITLAYLGDSSEYTSEQLAGLIAVATEFASICPALSGHVSGIGRFLNVPKGEKTPIYASVDMVSINEWREILCSMLARSGYRVSTDHGFTPHITLDYIDASAPMPPYSPPTIPLVFDCLTLAIAGQRFSYVLRGE